MINWSKCLVINLVVWCTADFDVCFLGVCVFRCGSGLWWWCQSQCSSVWWSLSASRCPALQSGWSWRHTAAAEGDDITHHNSNEIIQLTQPSDWLTLVIIHESCCKCPWGGLVSLTVWDWSVCLCVIASPGTGCLYADVCRAWDRAGDEREMLLCGTWLWIRDQERRYGVLRGPIHASWWTDRLTLHRTLQVMKPTPLAIFRY